MTDHTPDSATPQKQRVEVSRTLLIVAAIFVVMLLAVIAILVGGLVQASREATNTAPSALQSSRTAKPAPQLAQPQISPTLAPVIYDIGQTFTVGNVTMTVNSVEVLNSVATNAGPPLTPDAGGQLVLFKTTYSNSNNQADLSCGDTGLYLQVFDVEGKEMAPVFENPRIPGNPACNDYLLQGVSHEWNFVFQSVAGATPNALSVTETDTYSDPTFVQLRQQ